MALSCLRSGWLKERARQAEHQHYDDDALTDEEVAEFEQGELARQFAAAQNQRYGDSYAGGRG